MLLSVNFCHTGSRGLPPSEENDTTSSHSSYKVNCLLSEPLPPLVGVAVGLMCADSKTGIKHQNTTIRPWYKQTTIVRWRLEARVALLNTLIDVDE